jgi:hypothetical protein
MSAERSAEEARLAGGDRSAQGPGLRAVGIAVARLAAPIVKKRGGGPLGRLKAGWATIVGPPWDTRAWPLALGRDGALKLRVAPEAALELQHRGPLLIERINLFFGRPVVVRLTLIQGPLPFAAAPPPAIPLQPAGGMMAPLELPAGIGDPQLRAALVRLRQAISAAGR